MQAKFISSYIFYKKQNIYYNVINIKAIITILKKATMQSVAKSDLNATRPKIRFL